MLSPVFLNILLSQMFLKVAQASQIPMGVISIHGAEFLLRYLTVIQTLLKTQLTSTFLQDDKKKKKKRI